MGKAAALKRLVDYIVSSCCASWIPLILVTKIQNLNLVLETQVLKILVIKKLSFHKLVLKSPPKEA